MYRAHRSIRGARLPDPTSKVYVTVVDAGRRPESRGMEEPVYLGRSASRLAEPGKCKFGSGLAHAPTPPLLAYPRTPAPAPALALLTPLAGRGREGGGRLSRDYATGRRRGA